MPNKKKLRTIRRQLVCMIDFMANTPGGDKGRLRWCGEMPAYPKEYTPEDWQTTQQPIWIMWINYLAELEYVDFSTYRALADELNVADLLAASEEESKKFYIHEKEATE